MRWLLPILLLLCSPVWGAYIEHYVTSGGTDTWANATSSGTPCSLATAFANCAAGERANIQSDGAYSIGATTITNAGTPASAVMYRGYGTTIGDLEGQGRNADGLLDTTNFPAITLTGILTPKDHIILQNLSITGAVAARLITSSSVDYMEIISCSLLNTLNNSSAGAVILDNGGQFINSDFECSGAAHNIIAQADTRTIVVGSRFKGVDNKAMVSALDGTVENSVFIGNNTGIGILIEQLTSAWVINQNTFYNFGTAVQLPNSLSTYTPMFTNNHATDNSKWLDSLYSVTANVRVIEINNRTRDNTTPRTGIGDGVLIGEITTDTGGPETDYVNAGAGNFRLISGAPGESAGLIAYSDIGAYQREPSAGGGSVIVILEE